MKTQIFRQGAAARHVSSTNASQRIVGSWHLEGLLGAGRFTEVFAARADGSSAEQPADYALKLLKPHCAEDPRSHLLLAREAQAARDVASPHLISVLAAQTNREPRYLVAPRLLGGTLGAMLSASHHLASPIALWIARQTADALCSMHAKGWMHGDIKPENIFVARNGHVTLLDLGFARQLNAKDDRLELAGSLTYLAPEMFTVDPQPSAACDIYSLGVTLYETVTGQPPFTVESEDELALAHLREPPPNPRSLRPNLSPRLCRLLREMLAKEPLRRPSSEELVERLLDLEIDTFEDRQISRPLTA